MSLTNLTLAKTLKNVLAGAALLCAGQVQVVHADALGAPDVRGRWGYAMALSRVSIDDPQGPTETVTTPFPFNVVYAYSWREPLRLWGEGFYHVAVADPSPTEIGQDLSRVGGRLLLHRRLDFPGRMRWWAGGGLTLARERFTVRQQVDSDGFGIRYGDRSELSTGITLDALSEWRLNKNWDSAAHLLYDSPLGNGVEELSLSITFLFTR